MFTEFKTLQDDLTFKNVFSHEELLTDLINSFLEFEHFNSHFYCTEIKVQNYILPNKQKVKGFYGDIVAILDNGYIISIEMYKNEFNKRDYKKSFNYLCRLVSNQLQNGNKRYEDTKKVIGISFIKGNYKKMNNKIINSYEFSQRFTEKVVDEGDLELYLIRIDKIEKVRYNKNNEVRFIKWLRFLNAKSIQELEEIAKGDEVMEN